jgi:hypothetical protein
MDDGALALGGVVQGCQIFIVTTLRNGKNIPNGHKIYQLAVK